ncbi:MAG: hypothetical protein KGL19_07470 [Bacteroidota bacterium]|nr:hypothetical protein [Bacteroidota bacterium]
MPVKKSDCALEFSFKTSELQKLIKTNPDQIVVRLELGKGKYTITASAHSPSKAKTAKESLTTNLQVLGCPFPPGCNP